MVGVASCTQADAGEARAQLLNLIGTHDFRIAKVGTAGHSEAIVSCSLFVRPKEIHKPCALMAKAN